LTTSATLSLRVCKNPVSVHEGYLRHLLVRKAVKTQQILVDVVTTTQIEFDMAELVNSPSTASDSSL